MNREEIICKAREIAVQCCNQMPSWQNDYAMSRIMELIDASAAAEREACAKVCENFGEEWYCRSTTDEIATAIRAKGQV